MKTIELEDSDILKGLSDEQKRGHYLNELYRLSRCIIRHLVLSNNGSEDDVDDLLQDTIIAFYRNFESGVYQPTSKISTYIYSIARNLWLNELKKRSRNYDFRLTNELEENDTLQSICKQERRLSVRGLLEELSPDYKMVWTYSLYYDLSTKEIQEKMGYSSEQVVRNKKWKALCKIRERIGELKIQEELMIA